MKTLLLTLMVTAALHNLHAQKKTPDLTKIDDRSQWTLHNRAATQSNGEVHLDARDNDGLLWFKKFSFTNGTIELDIKGRDLQGQSFVGIAFHIVNDSTYDAVYFRPFNFKNPQRADHSVQYISHPQSTWFKLREEHPGKYENTVAPVPDPNGWFHARIEVNYPHIQVFVDQSATPSLQIDMLSEVKTGPVGFWVGNGAEGTFRNLVITNK